MGRNNWEAEDGMGFAGMVPTLAEKREEADRERAFARELKLRQSLVDAENRNRELTRQVEQLQAKVDAADKAMSAAESFIAVMFGHGPDALIPETVNTPLGIPIQLRKIMFDLVLAQSLTAPPSSAPTDPGRAEDKS